jgi:hypothetical protein
MFVEARTIGQRDATLQPREFDLSDLRHPTLRELIGRVVREELAAYDASQQQRALLRVLSPADLARGAETGRYAAEPRERQTLPSPDEAVATALQAFQDELFVVFVDDRQVEDLDALLTVGPGTRLRFLRLVALAGG